MTQVDPSPTAIPAPREGVFEQRRGVGGQRGGGRHQRGQDLVINHDRLGGPERGQLVTRNDGRDGCRPRSGRGRWQAPAGRVAQRRKMGSASCAVSRPVRTAATPGMARAAVVSMPRMRAWACGLCSSLPCNMPGMAMSNANRVRPVTRSRALAGKYGAPVRIPSITPPPAPCGSPPGAPRSRSPGSRCSGRHALPTSG